MSPEHGHPDWNDLAALAEGREIARAPEVRRHLATCRSCAAALAEAVRLRAREQVAPSSLEVPPAYLRAATAAGPGGERRTIRRRVAGAVAAVACSVALLMIVLPDGDRDPLAVDAVRRAVLDQTPSGMVLPGLAPAQGREPAVYRGPPAGRTELAAELDMLQARYRRDTSVDNAFWLGVAHLAAGHVQAATDLVREARRRHPEALDLQLLDAVASYRRSDLGRAETLLREILVRRSDHAETRFNLALVLRDTGRPDAARRLLAETRWRQGSWLADRAASLRDTLR